MDVSLLSGDFPFRARVCGAKKKKSSPETFVNEYRARAKRERRQSARDATGTSVPFRPAKLYTRRRSGRSGPLSSNYSNCSRGKQLAFGRRLLTAACETVETWLEGTAPSDAPYCFTCPEITNAYTCYTPAVLSYDSVCVAFREKGTCDNLSCKRLYARTLIAKQHIISDMTDSH